MSKTKKLMALLLVVAMLFTFVSVIAACKKQDECEKNGHKLTAVQRKEATTEAAGYEAYWKCDVCGKLFSDKDGKNEIDKPKVLPQLQPAPHECGHQCPTCGKCTDATCTDPACADKCPGHQTVDPDKGKTKDNPLTVDEAITLMKQAGSGVVVGAAEKQQYYVQGVVNTGSTVDTQYHEWSFTLGSGSEKATCQATVDNSVTNKPSETNGALDGVTVIIHGFLELFNGQYKIAYLPQSVSPTGAKFTPVLVDVVMPVEEVTSITLDHTEDLVLLANHTNKYMILDATVLPANAPQDVVWTVSENNANITVDNGRISWTETEGEATITATATGTDKSASVKVIVKNVKGATQADPLTVDEALALMTEEGVEVFAGYAANNKQGFYLTGKVANSKFHTQGSSTYWTYDLEGTEGTLSCASTFGGIGYSDGLLDDYTVVLRSVFLKRTASEYAAGSTDKLAIGESATRPALTGIQIDESVTIDMGGSARLQATPVPANALLDGIEWHTSAEQTATVSNGVVVGVAAGAAEITASVGEVTSNKCTVTVNAVEGNKAVYDFSTSLTEDTVINDLYKRKQTGDILDNFIKVWSPGLSEIISFTVANMRTGTNASNYGLYYTTAVGGEGTIEIKTTHQITAVSFRIIPASVAQCNKFTVNGNEVSKTPDGTWTGKIGSAYTERFEFDQPTDTINFTAPYETLNQFLIIGITLEW